MISTTHMRRQIIQRGPNTKAPQLNLSRKKMNRSACSPALRWRSGGSTPAKAGITLPHTHDGKSPRKRPLPAWTAPIHVLADLASHQLMCGQLPNEPLVDGTSSLARRSIATAARNARASPLKHDSDI